MNYYCFPSFTHHYLIALLILEEIIFLGNHLIARLLHFYG